MWTWEIVSVEPLGDDVRVRDMRVQSVDDVCPDILVVQAAERIVRHSTVQAVAALPVCDMAQRTIDAALERARRPRPGYVDYMSSQHVLVADCGRTQHVLDLVDRPRSGWVNFDTLHRTSPTVSALWALMARLSSGMLPETSAISSPAAEALGTSLLPELRSAKYAVAFGTDLVKQLEGYSGPPARRGPLPADVLERDALPLTVFAAPPFPPIAALARVSGDVRLRLTVNAETGDVREVETLAGAPLIRDAAVAAARGWKFDPARAPRVPVDVTVRFQIRCREN